MNLSMIYKMLKYYNDFKAIKNGRFGQRLYNRMLGKLFGRMFK